MPYFDVTDTQYTTGKIGPFSDKSFVRFGLVTTKALREPEIAWDQSYAIWEDGSARAEVRYSNITFTDPENDPVSGSYQWKYIHTPKFIANQGYSTLHNKTYTSNQLYFDKVGSYDITLSARDDPHPSFQFPSNVFDSYRAVSNTFTKRMIVHRKPVAQFTLSFNADNTLKYTDNSYDPDRWVSSTNYSAPEDGKNYQTTRGIFDRQYYYITPSGNYVANQLTRPSEYGTYYIGLSVRDEYGAWSNWAVQTIEVENPLPPNNIPVATMTYPSGSQASPSTSTDRTPILQWTQTDADAGTVFKKYHIQGFNEAGTVIIDTGERSQNTSSTTASFTPAANLPTTQKLQFRVRTNDGLEWSSWSAMKWILINNAPTAALTYPTGTQTNPTILTTKRPSIRWNQTDPDTDVVFRMYEVQITNEANTTVIATSGQVAQNTTSTTASWMVPSDLPNGKLRVRVRVNDGVAWSAWSTVRWMLTNRPPTAEFDWSPKPTYEGDTITLTDQSTDPDGDTLTYRWTITSPGGFSSTQTTKNASIAGASTVNKPGNYSVTLEVTDETGATDSVTKTITVAALGITGQVSHTTEWENKRQEWNAANPTNQRPFNTFWAGEEFVLSSNVTDTGTSTTKATRVRVTLVEEAVTVDLASSNKIIWSGSMWQNDFDEMPDGTYNFRFTVDWSNGVTKQDTVLVIIKESMWDVALTHRTH